MKIVQSTACVMGACLALGIGSSFADDTGDGSGAPVYGLQIELGAGAKVAPEHEGSDEYEVSPFPIIRPRQLTLGTLNIGDGDPLGLSFLPSFRFISNRRSEDVDGLPGLRSISTAFELGIGVAYEQTFWRVFGNLRHGVTGHDGLVGELGADLIFRPNDDWKVTLGPRLSFADGNYTDTYFGVPAGIAGPTAFDPEGGLKSAGVEARTRYQVTPVWAVEGSLGWMRLVGDAADSPVTRAGDDDQVIGRIGILRRFSFGY